MPGHILVFSKIQVFDTIRIISKDCAIYEV